MMAERPSLYLQRPLLLQALRCRRQRKRRAGWKVEEDQMEERRYQQQLAAAVVSALRLQQPGHTSPGSHSGPVSTPVGLTLPVAVRQTVMKRLRHAAMLTHLLLAAASPTAAVVRRLSQLRSEQ